MNSATMNMPADAKLTNDEILDLLLDENDQLREGYARTLPSAASEKAVRWCLRHLSAISVEATELGVAPGPVADRAIREWTEMLGS